jgi:hypothetical protein
MLDTKGNESIDKEQVQSPALVKRSGERTVSEKVFDTKKLSFQSRVQKLREINELVRRAEDAFEESEKLSILSAMRVQPARMIWHCDKCFASGFVGVSP